jgi:hypothetical protein
MKQFKPLKQTQRGYLMVSMGMALILSSILMVAGLRDAKTELEDTLVEHAGDEMEQILQAGVGYYVQHRSFPTKSQLISSGLIPATEWGSPFRNNYSVRTVGSGANLRFRVQLNADQHRYANALTARLPFGRLINATTVIGEVVTPATERSHQMLYARDGSNGGMLADVDMSNYSLRNAKDIWANRLCDRSNGAYCIDPGGNSRLNRARVNNVEVYGTTQSTNFKVRGAGTDLNEAVTYGNVVPHNGYFPKPRCNSGYRPQGWAIPVAWSSNSLGTAIGGVQGYARSAGSRFRAKLRVFTKDGWVYPSNAYGYLATFTKCTKI